MGVLSSPPSPGLSLSENSDSEIQQCSSSESDNPAPPRKKCRKSKAANKNKGGRQWDPVWDKYEVVNENKKKTAKCKACKIHVSARAPRLRSHLKVCKKVNDNRNSENFSQQSHSASQSTTHDSQSGTESSQFSAPASQSSAPASQSSFASSSNFKPMKQTKMTRITERITAAQKEELDIKLGRFIFSANLPFSVVQNPEFIEFVRGLNPAYRVPSDDAVGSTILEKVYSEVQSSTTKQLKDKQVCILQDGWSTNQNDSIIAHCLTTGTQSIFLNCDSAGTNKKSADFCESLLDKAISKATDMYGCEVVGLCTDNCSSMVSMRQKVQTRGFLDCYGCHAHLFNLIGSNFTPNGLIQEVNAVQVFMKKHHFTKAALKDAGKRSPVLACSTRWNSQIDSLSNFANNQTDYLNIVRRMPQDGLSPSGKEKYQAVLKTLEDTSIYYTVTDAVKLLKPITLALEKVFWLWCSMLTLAQKSIMLGFFTGTRRHGRTCGCY